MDMDLKNFTTDELSMIHVALVNYKHSLTSIDPVELHEKGIYTKTAQNIRQAEKTIEKIYPVITGRRSVGTE